MNTIIFQNIHWLAVLLGGLGYFALGAIWYSKVLFSKKWIAYTKIDINAPNATDGIAQMFIGSFALMVVTSLAVAILANKLQTVGWVNGAKLGLFTGICFGVTAIAVSYLYEKRPLGLHLINGGYTVLGNMIAGIIVCSL